jgi:hypothetical protein
MIFIAIGLRRQAYQDGLKKGYFTGFVAGVKGAVEKPDYYKNYIETTDFTFHVNNPDSDLLEKIENGYTELCTKSIELTLRKRDI